MNAARRKDKGKVLIFKRQQGAQNNSNDKIIKNFPPPPKLVN